MGLLVQCWLDLGSCIWFIGKHSKVLSSLIGNMALRPSSTLVILCLRCMGWSCQLKDHGLPIFDKSIWVRHHHSIESEFSLETSVPSNLQTMLLYLYLLKHLKFLYFFESWEHKTARYARYHHGILREIRTHCRKEKTEIREDFFSQHIALTAALLCYGST